jgi:hypothetical protein
MLRGALGIAVKDGQIARNVAALVDAPRVPRREVHAFNPDQARAFIEAVHGQPAGSHLHRGFSCRASARRDPWFAVDRCEPRNRSPHSYRSASASGQEIGPSRAEISHELPKHPVTRSFRERHHPPQVRTRTGPKMGGNPLAGDWLRVLLPGSVRRLMPGIASQLVLFLEFCLQLFVARS